jgi:TatD DNase family protein
MTLSDAHCHLQDPRIAGLVESLLEACRARGIRRWMVNATRESDWGTVASLSSKHQGVYASFGLHPWWQKQRSPCWRQSLQALLEGHPEAAIGETGLDRWMPDPDLEDQRSVLNFHLELSSSLNRPVTLHCLRAWPELADCVKRRPPSSRGFLLHSYSGPPAEIARWADAGAYFSFSPALLAPGKSAVREMFKTVPLERLLVETDAPDMAPPRNLAIAEVPFPASSGDGGKAINHPLNLVLCLAAMAADRGLSEAQISVHLESNVRRLFGWPEPQTPCQ